MGGFAAHPAFYQSAQFKAHPGAAYAHAVREEMRLSYNCSAWALLRKRGYSTAAPF